MTLIHVLANVYQIAGLIETVNIDDLHSHLLNSIGLWLCVECNSLANWKIRTNRALKLILNHEVYVEIQLDWRAHLQ